MWTGMELQKELRTELEMEMELGEETRATPYQVQLKGCRGLEEFQGQIEALIR